VSTDLSAHPVFDAGILEGLHLLEADAGTGKTWTIAGLVVRALVERGLGIEQLLVVTFTNAATAELGARIRQRIAQLERLLDDRLAGRASAVDEPFCVAYAARLDDDAARSARSALRIALARVDEMAVHTIHGFCQRVIDEHALSIGVAAGLPVSAGSAAPELARLADWWRAQAREASAARMLAFGMAGLAPASLRAAVHAIAASPLARIAPAGGDWRRIEDALAALRGELGAALEREGRALLDWIAVKGNADGKRFRVDWATKWLDALRRFCADPQPASLPEAAGRLAARRFGERTPPSSIPEICERLVELAADIERLPAWIAQELAAAAAAARADDLAQAQALGFDDLLRVVHDALADPEGGPALARALRERYPMALIDECQDTDPLQWGIFRRIHVDEAPGGAGGVARALVLVGDPKQAIYAFRGADVYSYLDARDAIGRLHRLGENQRSSPALIAAVNALFRRERPFLVDEIGFSDAGVGARPRRALAAPDGDERAALTLVRLEAADDAGWLDAAAARRQAVGACVAEIGRLVRGGARLGESALRPADIAVLVNTHRQGTEIKRALAAAGIGAAEVSRDSVLATLECAELMRIVAAIADPADPGLLRAALATTLLGEDAGALLALDADPGRALQAAARFARAREDWQRHGPIAALRRLIRDEGVGARLAATRDGDRRLTNLMHLVELLGDDEDARRGPQPALQAWARRRAGGATDERETEELRLESDEDLVRILTVHKSKGLEFPVVFLPYAWSGRAPGTANPRTWHERTPDGGWRAVLDFLPTPEAERQFAAEWHGEALRAMYVALTRAEQRCYLFWGVASGAQFSPLAWLLADVDPSTQHDWRPGFKAPPPLDDGVIDRGLDAWRSRASSGEPGALRVVSASALAAGEEGTRASDRPAGEGRAVEARAERATVPAVPGVAAPAGEGAPALAARPWHATIAAPRVTTSFTAIVSALQDDDGGNARAQEAAERPDHDQRPTALEPGVPAGESSIRFRFPAGAQAGVCLHGVLEDARFDARFDRRAVAERLARAGFRRFDPEQVSDWLEQVVATPMRAAQGETIRLPEVPMARQVRELDFLLAGDAVSDRALIEAVDAEFRLDAAVGAARWSGFLRGFVDLVFEHGGRYYLLDWKSNHLGDTPAHYSAAALGAAMRAGAYPLQACLYALALHRWLRRRLRGYDYERDFGGALYVFLRGAGLAAPGVDGAGVHAIRPSAKLMDRLDRLLATVPEDALR